MAPTANGLAVATVYGDEPSRADPGGPAPAAMPEATSMVSEQLGGSWAVTSAGLAQVDAATLQH